VRNFRSLRELFHVYVDEENILRVDHKISFGLTILRLHYKISLLPREDDLARQTSGVECRKDVGVLDEIPGAYKSIEAVMKNQEDLVEIVAEIKQVVCVKG